MKKILLGIIAINLTFLSIITTLNYMQTANAAAATAKDIVNQLEEGGLFEGNKDERACYENFFIEEGMNLNRLSKKIGSAIEVWKKVDSEPLVTSFDIFEPGEECGGQDSSWTSACPLSEKEMESLHFIMGPIFAAEFTCL